MPRGIVGGWCGGGRGVQRAVHSALCFPPRPASSLAWPGMAWPCSHRAWLSALTLITVYLSGPVTTGWGGGGLQIKVLLGYSPGHNTIIYWSSSHKDDLLWVLGPVLDLRPRPISSVGSQDLTSLHIQTLSVSLFTFSMLLTAKSVPGTTD